MEKPHRNTQKEWEWVRAIYTDQSMGSSRMDRELSEPKIANDIDIDAIEEGKITFCYIAKVILRLSYAHNRLLSPPSLHSMLIFERNHRKSLQSPSSLPWHAQRLITNRSESIFRINYVTDSNQTNTIHEQIRLWVLNLSEKFGLRWHLFERRGACYYAININRPRERTPLSLDKRGRV